MRGLQFDPPEAFGRIRIVLMQPSHPGNVGAAARAMRVMGLGQMVVVDPRFPDVLQSPDALAFASGAVDVLERACVCATLEEALEPVSYAIAVSASSREFGPQPQPPWVLAGEAFKELARDPAHQVAFVFGPERTGLSIESVSRCHALVSIPTAPGYGSLNLAQSVQVIAYALSCESVTAQTDQASDDRRETSALQRPPIPWQGRIASHEAVERVFEHLERSMIGIGFIDPRHPKKLMPRLRRLLSRTRLEVEEVDILRGICTQIDRQVEMARRETRSAADASSNPD